MVVVFRKTAKNGNSDTDTFLSRLGKPGKNLVFFNRLFQVVSCQNKYELKQLN